jgi:hypothetical protein
MTDVLTAWVAELAAALGVDPAHSVARPAAPLTTFLVGYAAGQRGGGPDAVRAAAETAARLATAHHPS